MAGLGFEFATCEHAVKCIAKCALEPGPARVKFLIWLLIFPVCSVCTVCLMIKPRALYFTKELFLGDTRKNHLKFLITCSNKHLFWGEEEKKSLVISIVLLTYGYGSHSGKTPEKTDQYSKHMQTFPVFDGFTDSKTLFLATNWIL